MSEQEFKEVVKEVDKEIEDAKNSIALQIEALILVAFFLGLLVPFSFFYFKDIFPTVALTVLAGVINWRFIKDRVYPSMDLAIKTIREAFENKYEEDRKKPIMDLISLAEEEYGLDSIEWIPYFGKSYKKPQEFYHKVNGNKAEFYASQAAINALLYFNIKDGKKRERLKSIVAMAIENIGVDRGSAEFECKSKHLYAYLRGWLICSIKYGRKDLPINLIQDKPWNQAELIKAIQYIKTEIIMDERMKEKIKNEDSRKMICEYLNILIEKI